MRLENVFLTGNDINWDEVIYLNEFIVELEMAKFEGEVEVDEYGYVSDEDYERYADSNPTIIYYDGETLDIQEILKKGEKIDKYVSWYIMYNTNNNSVMAVGDVPDDCFTDEFLQRIKEEV